MARRWQGPLTVEQMDLGRGIRYQRLRYFIKIEQKGKIQLDGGEVALDTAVARAIMDQMSAAAEEQLRSELRRPNASTGRLAKAFWDDRGRRVVKNRIEMFIASFYDEYVPYWRAIDQGSTASLGRLLSGAWTLGGEVTPWGEGTGQRLYRQGASSRILAVRRTRKAATAARRLLRAQGVPAERARKVTGIIREPIHAHHFVRAAREAFHRAQAQQLADAYIRREYTTFK